LYVINQLIPIRMPLFGTATEKRKERF
jgi:hypothetical protein